MVDYKVSEGNASGFYTDKKRPNTRSPCIRSRDVAPLGESRALKVLALMQA